MPRRGLRLVLAAGAMAAVPIGVLAVLAASGELAAGPALLGGLAVGLGALALARLWIEDLRRLRRATERAEEARGAAGIAPVLTPLREAAEAIERLARRLREETRLVNRLLRADQAIIELLPDPLIVLGQAGEPLRANRAARSLLGPAPAGGEAAAPAGDLSAVLRHPALRGAIDRATTERTPQSAALTLPVPVERDLVATAIPVDPPLADGGRAIIVLSDRTRERRIEQMRADFVANASHELRTPLASLIGFIETLRGPAADDPKAQARFLGIMHEQAGRMIRLVEDLMQLSRVELLEHTAPEGSVAVGQVVAREAELLAQRAEARRVRLELHLEDDLPEIRGDAEQIGQVAQNLIENAVRYGREGGVVRLAVRRVAPAEGTGGRGPRRPGIALVVSDDGPGIAKHHLHRLTERFYRADPARSRAAGGTGLGLAIVKHIVNRHRGLLSIESEEGEGATFTVWLPLERGAVPEPLRRASG